MSVTRLADAVAGRDRRRASATRGRVLVVVAAVLACAGLLTGAGSGLAEVAGPAAVLSAASPGTWGKAAPVPGLAALNKDGNARVVSVSCWTAGNCAAGGYYDGRFPDFGAAHALAFVVREKNGRWGKAAQVPGIAALDEGANAEVSSVSCVLPGACAAGGYYTDASGHQQGFVTTFRDGRWNHAIELPGLAGLNTGGAAGVSSASCPSPGNCVAGGTYTDADGVQGFVASQHDGRWHPALAVPGLSVLNTGGVAAVNSVSCASAGNCTAGGSYQVTPTPTDNNPAQAFVVTEKNGRWGSARQIPGLAALNAADWAGVTTLSCRPDGNCAAGGYYLPVQESALFGFVVSEKNGRWGTAEPVTYHAYLVGGPALVSCPSAGNCGAAGSYDGDGGPAGVWVMNEKRGTWDRAAELTPTLAQGNANAVSCWSAGNCVVGGSDIPGAFYRAFVASEKNGSWGRARQVPGLGALSKGGDYQVLTVSCAPGGTCVAGGYYTAASGQAVGFVVTRAK